MSKKAQQAEQSIVEMETAADNLLGQLQRQPSSLPPMEDDGGMERGSVDVFSSSPRKEIGVITIDDEDDISPRVDEMLNWSSTSEASIVWSEGSNVPNASVWMLGPENSYRVDTISNCYENVYPSGFEGDSNVSLDQEIDVEMQQEEDVPIQDVQIETTEVENVDVDANTDSTERKRMEVALILLELQQLVLRSGDTATNVSLEDRPPARKQLLEDQENVNVDANMDSTERKRMEVALILLELQQLVLLSGDTATNVSLEDRPPARKQLLEDQDQSQSESQEQSLEDQPQSREQLLEDQPQSKEQEHQDKLQSQELFEDSFQGCVLVAVQEDVMEEEKEHISDQNEGCSPLKIQQLNEDFNMIEIEDEIIETDKKNFEPPLNNATDNNVEAEAPLDNETYEVVVNNHVKLCTVLAPKVENCNVNEEFGSIGSSQDGNDYSGWFCCGSCLVLLKAAEVTSHISSCKNPKQPRVHKLPLKLESENKFVDNAFQCKVCKIVYLDNYAEHLLDHHPDIYRTLIVKKRNRNKRNRYSCGKRISKHFAKIRFQAVHRCGICKTDSLTLLGLQTHLQMHHPKLMGRVDLFHSMCICCDKYFPDTFQLVGHVAHQ